MSSYRPGDYITAKCRRCNDITGHVIMLVLDGRIAKVECKACGSVHKYREDKNYLPEKRYSSFAEKNFQNDLRQTENLKPRKIEPSSKPGTHPSGERHLSSPSKTESAWQKAILRHKGKAPQLYSMTGTFELQSLIDHPIFGTGEIVALPSPDKINVLFQGGIKTLRCKMAIPPKKNNFSE